MRPLTRPTVVTEFDRRRLHGLLQLLRRRSTADTWTLGALARELDSAEIVPPSQVPANVVTMNSRVALQDPDSGVRLAVELVFPASRTAESANLTVLSPLGLALLGRREGDVLEWPTQEGPRRLRVERVIYQPEASGNFSM